MHLSKFDFYVRMLFHNSSEVLRQSLDDRRFVNRHTDVSPDTLLVFSEFVFELLQAA
jgi:hypothetical protein